ncbi:MAG: ArsR family transcriptional regulator [Mesorhizobium sp.]|nr:MAG: ArsR family transcriptional regulator [Mesorhizobium sp.]
MVQLSLAVPRGEAGFWSIILELDKAGPWTVRQVSDRTQVRVQSARFYIRKLRLAGFVEVVEMRETSGGLPDAMVYRLVEGKKPQQAPRLTKDGELLPETAKEKLWRAMKMAKKFTLDDLVDACTDVPLATAKGYCFALSAAGVLAKQGSVFRLVNNLGSQAPRVLRAKLVFDPNKKVVVGSSIVSEVEP